jgi:hypothetical protein
MLLWIEVEIGAAIRRRLGDFLQNFGKREHPGAG